MKRIAAGLALAFASHFALADEPSSGARASSPSAAAPASGWFANGTPLVPDTSSPPPQPAPPAAAEPERRSLVAQGQDLIVHALAFLGVRYKYGGNNPLTGLDCSGFVQHVFREAAGITLPHNAYSMSLQGRKVQLSDLKPGDLVFFNTLKRAFSHVGIYIGDNRFVHAPSAGKTVEIVSMDNNYWTQRFNGARRLVADEEPQATAPR